MSITGQPPDGGPKWHIDRPAVRHIGSQRTALYLRDRRLSVSRGLAAARQPELLKTEHHLQLGMAQA